MLVASTARLRGTEFCQTAIDAREVPVAGVAQHAQVRSPSLGKPAELLHQYALAKPQLDVAREELPSLTACRVRLLEPALPHLGSINSPRRPWPGATRSDSSDSMLRRR